MKLSTQNLEKSLEKKRKKRILTKTIGTPSEALIKKETDERQWRQERGVLLWRSILGGPDKRFRGGKKGPRICQAFIGIGLW